MNRSVFRSFFFSVVLACLSLTWSAPASAANCSITTDTVVNQAYVNAGSCSSISIDGNVSTTWIGTVDLIGSGTVTVKSGYTMTMGSSSQMILGTTDDVIVESGATITHVVGAPSGIQITARNMTVDGSVNASVKGCPTNYNPDATTGVCVDRTLGTNGTPNNNYGGASYGGLGGNGYFSAPGSTYGASASSSPVLLGSSGPNGAGGGGRVTIALSGSLVLNGTIQANGTGNIGSGTGSSGGSVSVAAIAISGSGSIHADGGSTNNGNAGAGGGGRVALRYFSSTFDVNDTSLVGALRGRGGMFDDAQNGSVYLLQYSEPSIPSVTSPVSGVYNVSRNPTLTASAYDNAPGNLAHVSSDWKVTTDALGSASVWEASGSVSLTSIGVTSVDGVFLGSLVGETALAASTTYYAFVRYTNAASSSDWSPAVSFTTPYGGTSSTVTWNYDDATPQTTFTYNSGTVEVNASNNSYARLKDLGGGVYATQMSDITVEVASGGTHPTYNVLHRVEETLMPGTTGSVQYQLSSDGVTWKYWDGSAWSTVTNGQISTSNDVDTLNAYLPLFASQTGGAGSIYTRVLLLSNGSQPVGIDSLKLYYTPTNVDPSQPTTLGPASLVDGSTTSTVNPTFTFSLSDPDALDEVQYRIQIDDSSDFASPVVDYTSALGSQGVRSFTVGQASGGGSYIVGSSGQTLVDGSYYWRVRAIDAALAESSYTTANGGAIAFRVDAVVRTVQFYQSSASAIESVTATSIIITLDTTHFEDVQVQYTVTGGSADGSGYDYTLASGTATISAGETTTTIPLTIVDDLIAESDETLEVTLSSPLYATLGAKPTYTYTILDNDTAGVTISPLLLSVSEDGLNSSYGIVLQSQPTTTVQILLSPSISQLQLSTSTITFTSSTWNILVPVIVLALDDTRVDGTHVALITHAASSTGLGYTSQLALETVSVTIADNDLASSPGGGAVGSVLPIPLPNMMLLPPLPPLPEPVQLLPSPVSTEPLPLPTASTSPVSDLILKLVTMDANSLGVALSSDDRERIGGFIERGTSPETIALGSGERRAIFRDLAQVQGRVPSSVDMERLATGQIPLTRNLARERELQPRALSTFKTIFGHGPNFKVEKENLAWNTLMYRIRFPRDLVQEKEGIQEFKMLFRRAPVDPFQWATVRVLGYIQD